MTRPVGASISRRWARKSLGQPGGLSRSRAGNRDRITWLLYFGRITVEYSAGVANLPFPASISRTRSPCWARASATARPTVGFFEFTLADTIRKPRTGGGTGSDRQGPTTAKV